MAVGQLLKSFQRVAALSAARTQLNHSPVCVSLKTMVALSSPLCSKPHDASLPNSSWGSEMMRLYNHYNNQCEVETKDGEKKRGPWQKVPCYNRSLKRGTGGECPSKIQPNGCFFTRHIRDPGAGFEYVLFYNKEEDTCVCIFQPGYFLEGAPGYVHGGAIATMIDTVIGIHAFITHAPAVTANLNINYHSPILVGSTVVIESSLDLKEGRKIYSSCKVTNSDGSKLHTEATGLFLSVTVSHLLWAQILE